MSEIVGRYVRVDGCRTYHESAGTGPALCFLAPAGRETSHWHGALSHYSDRYWSMAIDLPGHGKSGFMPGDKKYLDSISEMARFIGTFWREIGVARVAVVGCSLGANLTYALAAMYPDVVTAIVPLQGAAFTVPLVNPGALQFMTHPHVSFIHHLADNVATLTGKDSCLEGRQYLVDSIAGVNPRALQADMTAYGGCDLRPELFRIKCPVLSVRGTEDWFVTEDLIDMTVKGLTSAPEVQRARLPGIGHFPHLEAPDELYRTITPFLERHHPPRG